MSLQRTKCVKCSRTMFTDHMNTHPKCSRKDCIMSITPIKPLKKGIIQQVRELKVLK